MRFWNKIAGQTGFLWDLFVFVILHVCTWGSDEQKGRELRNGEFREQCCDNSGEKIDVCTSSPDRGFAAQFSLPTTGKKTLAPRVGSGLRQIELNGTVLWEHYRLLYRSFQVCTHRTGLKLPFQNSPLAQFFITSTKSPETLKKSNLVSDLIFYGLIIIITIIIIIIIIIIIHTYIAPFS